MTRSRVLAGGLLAVVAGCSGKPPQPPCALTPAYALLPSPQIVNKLRDGQSANLAGTASGDQLLSHCRTQWNSVIEMLHCSAATDTFCDTKCSTEERAKCKEGAPRELVMAECRRQSIDVFRAIYTSCRDFHLCGSVLEPSSKACPS